MAHLGIAGPHWPDHVVQINPHVRVNMPARKYRLIKNSSASPGTLGTFWNGFDGMSSVCDYWADDASYFWYRWENPSGPDLSITVRMQLRFNAATSPTAPVRYHWYSFWESWTGTDRIASLEVLRPQLEMVQTFNPGTRLGPGWDNDLPLSEWLNVPFAFEYGSWADQPEYQPYHQNPFA